MNKLATAYTIKLQYEELKQEITKNFQFLTNLLQGYEQSNDEQLYQIAASFYGIQEILTAVVRLQVTLRHTLCYPINIENFKMSQQKPFFSGLFNQEFISMETVYKLFSAFGVGGDSQEAFSRDVTKAGGRSTFQLNLFLQNNKSEAVNRLQQKIRIILAGGKGGQEKTLLLNQKELVTASEYGKLLKDEQMQIQKISKLLELNKTFKNEYCKVSVTQNRLEVVQHVNMTKINIIAQTFRDMNIEDDGIDDEQLQIFLQEQGYKRDFRNQIQLNYLAGAYQSRNVSETLKTKIDEDDEVEIGNVLTLQQQQELARRQSLLEQQALERKRQEELQRLKMLQKLKEQQELEEKRKQEELERQLEEEKQKQEEEKRKQELERELAEKERQKQQKLELEAEKERLRIEKEKQEELERKQKEEEKQIKEEILKEVNNQEREIVEKMIQNMSSKEAQQYLQKVKDYKQIKNDIEAKKQEREMLLSNYQQNKDFESLLALNKNTQELAELYYQFHQCTHNLTDENFNPDKELFNKLMEAYDLDDVITMIKEKLSKNKNLDIPPYALDMILNHEFALCNDKDRIKENFLKFILKQYDTSSQNYLDYIIQQFYDQTDEASGNQHIVDYVLEFDQKFQEYFDKVQQANENKMFIMTIPIENQFQAIQQNGEINELFQFNQQQEDEQQIKEDNQESEITDVKQELQQLITQTQTDENTGYKTLSILKFEEETNQSKFLVPQFYTFTEEQAVDDDTDVQLQGLVNENPNIHRYFIIRYQDKYFEKRFGVDNSHQTPEIVLPQLRQISPNNTNKIQQPRVYKQRNMFCCAPPILK